MVNGKKAKVFKYSWGFYGFYYTLALSKGDSIVEGPNPITITATNMTGGTTTVTRNVYYKDTMPPSIWITSPSDETTINTEIITVTADIWEYSGITSVTINGIPAEVKLEDDYYGRYTATATVRLVEGWNRITAIATDVNGNTSYPGTTSVEFINTGDTAPPLITIASPENNSTVTTYPTTVRGIIDDNSATVTVNGVTAIVSDNTFTANVYLNEGQNNITVTATDIAGNKSSTVITVYQDTTPPHIISIKPPSYSLNVSVYSTITVIFNEPLDQSTLNFTLQSEMGNAVDGTVTYDESTSTAVFKPLDQLIPNMHYTVVIKSGLKDKHGNVSALDGTWLFRTEILPVNITITEPQNNATVYKAAILIKGTVESWTSDIGIKVNGVVAEINGDKWAATVPLIIGTNKITVEAIDGKGGTGKNSITVYAQSTQQLATITANPTSGIAPMTTTFAINTNISRSIISYRIDFEGDGVTDLEVSTPQEISHTYDNPGLYFPTVTIVDSWGYTYMATTALNVLSKDEVDALLKDKWEKMKKKLLEGDFAGVFQYFVESSKQRYQGIFTALYGRTADIAANMGDIQLIYVTNGVAKYRIRKQEADGLMTYYIYFRKDQDGLWRIKQF